MKGIRVRTPIVNRVLYGLLSMKYNSYEEASLDIGVSDDVLKYAVQYGRLPYKKNVIMISRSLGVPEHILFNKEDLKKRKIILENNILELRTEDDYIHPIKGDLQTIERIGVKKTRFRRYKEVVRPVLLALLIAENIKPSEFANMLEVNPGGVLNYIISNRNPRKKTYFKIGEILDFEIEYILWILEEPEKYFS